MYNKTIIGFGFLIFKIIKDSVSVIYQPQLSAPAHNLYLNLDYSGSGCSKLD